MATRRAALPFACAGRRGAAAILLFGAGNARFGHGQRAAQPSAGFLPSAGLCACVPLDGERAGIGAGALQKGWIANYADERKQYLGNAGIGRKVGNGALGAIGIAGSGSSGPFAAPAREVFHPAHENMSEIGESMRAMENGYCRPRKRLLWTAVPLGSSPLAVARICLSRLQSDGWRAIFDARKAQVSRIENVFAFHRAKRRILFRQKDRIQKIGYASYRTNCWRKWRRNSAAGADSVRRPASALRPRR